MSLFRLNLIYDGISDQSTARFPPMNEMINLIFLRESAMLWTIE